MAQAGLNYFEDAEIRKGTIELDSEAAKIVSYLIQQSRREHVSSDADSDSDSDADHHSHAASPDECHSTMSDDEDDTPADAAPTRSFGTQPEKLPEEPIAFILNSKKRVARRRIINMCQQMAQPTLFHYPSLSQQTLQHSMRNYIGDQQMYNKCSLMFDAKSILEHLDWDTNRMEMLGLVDYDK
ncbi:hypothetical protein CAPTEDRAFT_228406 [Capitella teleta]|uniref:ubiquitinyl hydrolase 1 n=1 Tax=Capitella teleta TaxID=283909 RepID=R7UMN7_CAPTE|nr:hypothetical protein CAPTEDRAFT_228406 [Capitella teleta]|eukprot:ELU07363.1 hypothetical protein CAPTEDRAFT_228406 [Capitella teleta]